MSDKLKARDERELRRRRHVRRRVRGSLERPRLAVCKSLRNMVAQLIDDDNGRTLAYCTTAAPGFFSGKDKLTKTAAAKLLGKKIATLAQERGIKRVVFDRNRYVYHGRIKAVADGAREGGLEI